MPNKSEQVILNVEPVVKTAINRLADTEGRSASSVCHQVMIKHLLEKGLLTPEMLLDC